ncbi:MAG: MFS transporter [Bacteroidota bacterium]
MELKNRNAGRTKFTDIFFYSTGDGVNSLVMNGIFAFAMLYYTEALGLNYAMAGIAMAVATFWDAITDPLMAYISDNTKSRFGRRHPYMLLGGITTILSFYFIWAVPGSFRADTDMLFWYLVVMNLLLRTSITIFLVSYVALGFEICTNYFDRAKLQGVKFGFNMAVNIAGPALAWTLFFKDPVDGTNATSIASNFIEMGWTFSIASLILLAIVLFATRKYIVDSRSSNDIEKFSFNLFVNYFKDIFSDKYSRVVFIFMMIVMLGIILVSSLQMYVYVYFMEFTAGQKSIVHGATMVGAGIGALIMPPLVNKWDKKPVAYYAVLVSVVSNVILLLLFTTGFFPKDLVSTFAGYEIPVSMIVFLIFNSLYWMGSGVLNPLAFSMMADISEVGKYKTGVLKDGGYGATLSFLSKVAMSIGMLITGYLLIGIGFVEGSENQSPEAINNLGSATFIVSAGIAIIAALVIAKYPINREFISRIKEALAARERGEEVKLDI